MYQKVALTRGRNINKNIHKKVYYCIKFPATQSAGGSCMIPTVNDEFGIEDNNYKKIKNNTVFLTQFAVQFTNNIAFRTSAPRLAKLY